jgi:hypothetical protein
MNPLRPGVKRKLQQKTKMWWAILITLLGTGFLTILFLNLRAGEK